MRANPAALTKSKVHQVSPSQEADKVKVVEDTTSIPGNAKHTGEFAAWDHHEAHTTVQSHKMHTHRHVCVPVNTYTYTLFAHAHTPIAHAHPLLHTPTQALKKHNICTYAHMNSQICVYIHTYKHTHTYIHTHTYTNPHITSYITTYIHTSQLTCIHTSQLITYIHTSQLTLIHIYVQS